MSKYDTKHLGKQRIYTHKNLTREQTTAPWWDQPCAGTLYKLMELGTHYGITEFDIAEAIGWGKRTIQNQINQIIFKSSFKDYITESKITQNNVKRSVYKMDPMFMYDNFERCHALMLKSHYIQLYGDGMTSPEKIMEEILNEMFNDEWLFTGLRQINNRIGSCYPDFTHKKLPFIIEVFGDYWHSKEITLINEDLHEKQKIEFYNERGFKCLVIWEKELKNRENVKKRISNFLTI